MLSFGEAFLELAPRIGLSCLTQQFTLRYATWLDQNQLLHSFSSCAGAKRLVYPNARPSRQLPDAAAVVLVH